MGDTTKPLMSSDVAGPGLWAQREDTTTACHFSAISAPALRAEHQEIERNSTHGQRVGLTATEYMVWTAGDADDEVPRSLRGLERSNLVSVFCF